MKGILEGWNLMRVLRLGLGLAILVQGIVANETMSFVAGLILCGLAIANIGGCGKHGCAMNNRSSNKPQRIK